MVSESATGTVDEESDELDTSEWPPADTPLGQAVRNFARSRVLAAAAPAEQTPRSVPLRLSSPVARSMSAPALTLATVRAPSGPTLFLVPNLPWLGEPERHEPLGEAALELVRATPTASSINELVALARLPEVEQVAVAQVIAAGDVKRVAEARAAVHAKNLTAAVPYPVTQAKVMGRQRETLRRLRVDVQKAVCEWEQSEVPEMEPYITHAYRVLALLEQVVVEERAVPLPEACPCGGVAGCTPCGGRGWVASPP